MATKNKTKTKVNIPVFLLVAMIVLGVISGALVYAHNKNSNHHNEFRFNSNVVEGIDVSEHNGYIDCQLVAKSQSFAFIRVGYRAYGNGEIYIDKRAIENLENASKTELPIGVYFYTQAINEAEAKQEADFVYDIIKKYDIQLPVIIDFEYPIDKNSRHTGRLYEANNDKEENAKIINAFNSRLQKKGYQTGVYASSSVLYRNIDTDKLIDDTLIWCADYNGAVTYNVDYSIWQYSERGSCDGVESKYVDLNYWYKN